MKMLTYNLVDQAAGFDGVRAEHSKPFFVAMYTQAITFNARFNCSSFESTNVECVFFFVVSRSLTSQLQYFLFVRNCVCCNLG